jgi:CxxC-x17-CxxC domain-containing protein
MGYFNRDSNNRNGRDSRGGGRGFSSFGRGRDDRGGRGDRDLREMFKAVCSSCGKDCEVPFRPTTGKPVYCSDCFEKLGGRSADNGRPERRSNDFERNDKSQAPRADNSKQFEELNNKLDKIIELLTPKEKETPKVTKAKKTKVVKETVSE